ncbi:arsR-family transcriptional regulator [Pectobacterium atrosepticum SCRI1043]|uniref:ArsR-family transcriptional regulator n=1 Tax=Pectobacterium atrosepticum (strain SCRI 1043 / ATCC BAA-672) TaxID=218491 RepID=Q6D6V8_PECAS|nr:metalloregulator ArsR/SmtB family transcription factor [Pectobacterium atrosepticum]GKV84781.1 transcriptional regulator [Pectobacterium carotovorum subsp. carotovorum]AIA70517.1 ArsR family transcriptional regulator [Pectobacterium atrosepticum]AIK13437.1 arsR-family transcriptional regulator [Pectobacterium atrosepticum]ATY90334.1 transcriptional regulator [Pectobacterium atrosepticum]KFX16456.1 ArsR family transcriptional regulator [Pectobacterium atrosepticum]
MNKYATTAADLLRALGNEQRLIILEWLANPRANFPEQQDGDLVEDGVCVGFITEKIGLSQPTVTGHLQYLSKAGIVTSKRIKNWVFYKLVSERLDEAIAVLSDLAKVAARHHKPSE